MNLGLRWDVYVPWIEKDNRQSNFDESTGTFVVASDNAVVNGVEVGRYLQTYSKGDLGPRFGFAYDLTGDGKTMIRGGFGVFWNFTPGGTSSSKAQNPPFLQSTALTPTPTAYGSNLLLKDGLPPPPGVDPNRPAAGNTRSIFDINFRDAYARQWNINVQRSFFTNYMLEVAYVGSQGRHMLVKGDPNQAPPVVGVTDANVNRPYARLSPALRTIGQVQSKGTLDYNALLVKFQRRFANNFSMLNSYTYGKAIDLNSDNDGVVTLTNVYDPQYNRGPADYDITHTLASSWIYEIPWATQKLYGGWQVSWNPDGAGRPAADGHVDAGRSVHGDGQPPEPDLRRQTLRPDDRSVVRHVLLRPDDRYHRDLRRFRPRRDPWSGGVQHRRLAHQEHEDWPLLRPRFASRRSTSSITRSSATRTRWLAMPPTARSRRCCRARRARSAARSSGRCSWRSRSASSHGPHGTHCDGPRAEARGPS